MALSTPPSQSYVRPQRSLEGHAVNLCPIKVPAQGLRPLRVWSRLVRSFSAGGAEMTSEARAGGRMNVVFTVSMVLCVIIGAWGLIDPDSMTGTMFGFTNYPLTGASWYWMMICIAFLILSISLDLGSCGTIGRATVCTPVTNTHLA